MIVLLEFYVNLQSFCIGIELILIPWLSFLSILIAFGENNSSYSIIRKPLEIISSYFGFILILPALIVTINSPETVFTLENLKSLLLPLIILLTSFPFLRIFLLFANYETLFVQFKSKVDRKVYWEMQTLLIKYLRFDLQRIKQFQRFPKRFIRKGMSTQDLIIILQEFENFRYLQVGVNYLKRAKMYIRRSCWIIFLCVIAIICVNSKFVLTKAQTIISYHSINLLRDIITDLAKMLIAVFSVFLLYSIGLKSKKEEDISLVKKYALYDLWYWLKRQSQQLDDSQPLDNPEQFYWKYIVNALELNKYCLLTLEKFRNLLVEWELGEVQKFQAATHSLLFYSGIDPTAQLEITLTEFITQLKGNVEADNYENEYFSVKNNLERSFSEYKGQVASSVIVFEKYLKN